jgi:hypothetical protein
MSWTKASICIKTADKDTKCPKYYELYNPIADTIAWRCGACENAAADGKKPTENYYLSTTTNKCVLYSLVDFRKKADNSPFYADGATELSD